MGRRNFTDQSLPFVLRIIFPSTFNIYLLYSQHRISSPGKTSHLAQLKEQLTVEMNLLTSAGVGGRVEGLDGFDRGLSSS